MVKPYRFSSEHVNLPGNTINQSGDWGSTAATVIDNVYTSWLTLASTENTHAASSTAGTDLHILSPTSVTELNV